MMIIQSIVDWLIPTAYATTNYYYVSEVLSDFSSLFQTTTQIVAGVLPQILGFLGVLIGLAVAIRYVKRWIGSR